MYHFGFVTRSTYILTTTRDVGYIHLVEISEELEHRTIVVLCLPEIVNNVQVEAVITHSGAITASATDDERFIATPERRIHTFTVMYGFLDPTREAATYTLFVPNETFLRYISDYEDRNKTLLSYIMWENWGPGHTRMLLNEGSFNWMRCVARHRDLSQWLTNVTIDTPMDRRLSVPLFRGGTSYRCWTLTSIRRALVRGPRSTLLEGVLLPTQLRWIGRTSSRKKYGPLCRSILLHGR